LVGDAIALETEIKKWRRDKKVALIRENNPTWEHLAADWGKPFTFKQTSRTAPIPCHSEPRQRWGTCCSPASIHKPEVISPRVLAAELLFTEPSRSHPVRQPDASRKAHHAFARCVHGAKESRFLTAW